MSKILILSTVLFGTLLFVLNDMVFKNKKKSVFYFAPPKEIGLFAFGFSEVYADILWIRLIKNIDFCSSHKGIPVYDGRTRYECEKGWSFKMADAITELDPRFIKVYQISGSILSVLMGDNLGAKKIYDKAIKNVPHYWKFYFGSGYHYLINLKEEEKAAELLKKAADLGGPYWLYALAAKTYSKLGKLLLSREILKEAIQKDESGRYKKALESKLKKVKQEIQKARNQR